MLRLLLVCVLLGPLSIAGTSRVLNAQEATSADPTAEIRASAQDFANAFSNHDADSLAEMWTDDGNYVDQNGERLVGRDAIKKEYERIFELYPDAKLDVAVDSIRLLSPTTAIEEGSTSVTPTPGGQELVCRYTAIHVQQDGKWKLANVQDNASDQASVNNPLSDLQWMVGQWHSEHAGTTAELSCDWIAENRFLKRDFQITRDKRVISSSIEIIGWDPVRQQVMSWSFSSQGGRSIGLWSRSDEGWLVQQSGIASNGMPTSSVNWWAPLADGALGWSAGMRNINGQPLTDPRDVVLIPVEPDKGDGS